MSGGINRRAFICYNEHVDWLLHKVLHLIQERRERDRSGRCTYPFLGEILIDFYKK